MNTGGKDAINVYGTLTRTHKPFKILSFSTLEKDGLKRVRIEEGVKLVLTGDPAAIGRTPLRPVILRPEVFTKGCLYQ